MNTISESETHFREAAGAWDTVRASYNAEEVREAVISKGHLRPEMVVADVGAGTGFTAVGLAPLVSRVHVVDGSPAMLDVARHNLAAYANVIFHAGNGSALPLGDASVDVVFATLYLHHCPDPAAALGEMARVLRPAGRLVLSDLDAHDHALTREEAADEWPGFRRGDVKAWLREAGLVNVLVSDAGQHCRAEPGSASHSPAEGQPAGISIFVATGSRPVIGVTAAVAASYGAVADGRADSCCGDVNSCCEPADGHASISLLDSGYSSLVSEIPTAAAGFSLGCGVPLLFADLQPGEVVLDIGSGGGLDALLAARQVGPSGGVIGLDMTPAMIERARSAAREGGYANVDFRLGRAEEMPVLDNSVDVVISNCVINLSEDKGRVFEEAERVLKPGGRLAISDVVSECALPSGLRRDPSAWAGCVNGALPEREYLDLIAAAGFTEISSRRSAVYGEQAGVPLYSLAVTARKRP